jgi:AraC-like DNA-binding protein
MQAPSDEGETGGIFRIKHASVRVAVFAQLIESADYLTGKPVLRVQDGAFCPTSAFWDYNYFADLGIARIMDVISDVLKSVRLEGAVYTNAEFTEPWCVVSRFGLPFVAHRLAGHERVFFFHFIADGQCQVKLRDRDDVIHAGAGDFILFTQDEPHLIGSDVQLLPVEAAELKDTLVTNDGVLQIRHGGGGKATRFVCGYIACSKSLDRTILDGLPRALRIPMGDGATAELLGNMLRMAVRESANVDPGGESILVKMSEFIFAEALRGYIRQLPSEATGWLAALRDKQIGKALALLHDSPGHAWTVTELARDVALSKSVLVQRFTSLVGVPPIKYLKRWRLALAAQELREGSAAIVRVASDSGYDSEAAFNRAFRREFGLPPAAWRKAASHQGARLAASEA